MFPERGTLGIRVVKPSSDKQRFVSFQIQSNCCRWGCITEGDCRCLLILISRQKPLWRVAAMALITMAINSTAINNRLSLWFYSTKKSQIPTSQKWLAACERSVGNKGESIWRALCHSTLFLPNLTGGRMKWDGALHVSSRKRSHLRDSQNNLALSIFTILNFIFHAVATPLHPPTLKQHSQEPTRWWGSVGASDMTT